MASYRPFRPPLQSTFPLPLTPLLPPSQNPLRPTAPPPPSRGGNQYLRNRGPHSGNESLNYYHSYSQTNPSSNYQLSGYGSSSSQQQHFNPLPGNQNLPLPQQQLFQYQPPPPPPESSSYPPPGPPLQATPAPPLYGPSSRYSQYNQPQLLQPTQPPPHPPPPSSPLPCPAPSQPSSPLPLPSVIPPAGMSRESRHSNLGALLKQESIPPLPSSGKKLSGLGMLGRAETEEERRLRKKREYEKQKQEEKRKQYLRESENKVLQKIQMLASGAKGRGSVSESHMAERSTPLLSGERIENRLKRPTMFLCKLKFRNELPDPSAKGKLLPMKRDPDRYCKYQTTSLEKNWKPELDPEPDLGMPLDLLDMSVYNPPKGERIPLDPEDEELLRCDDPITPIKTNGFKKKERPTDKGVSWLVKTQYMSPLSMNPTKQSLTEKQAKELRESRRQNLLEDFINKERKIQGIMASFEACKSQPVHVNHQLKPKRVLPLFPYFDRYNDQFVVANFDSAPTADSEIYRKLSAADRLELERRAIMKSYMASSSDTEKTDKFLAYMVPSIDGLAKDMYDENEDVSYSWVREYHWDVRGEDADDPRTYLVAFGESEAKYLPLPTKLILRKKRAIDGKSSEELEHVAVPKTVTVRSRSTVDAVALRDERDFVASKESRISSRSGRGSMGGSVGRLHRIAQDTDADNFSGAEDDMSD